MLLSKCIALAAAVALFVAAASGRSSCSSKYPGSIALDQEFERGIRLPTESVNSGYKYFYYNARARVSFSVSFALFSGNPDLFVSRASFSLHPTAEAFEFQSTSNLTQVKDLIDLDPTADECYAIGVRASSPTSFALEFNDYRTPFGVVLPLEQPTCFETFPEAASNTRWVELKDSVRLSTMSVPAGSTTYFYYNAKFNEPFSVLLPENSGDVEMYASRAVVTLKPSGEELAARSSNKLWVDPTVDECYAIAVYAYMPASFVLEVQGKSQSVAVPMKQSTCFGLFPEAAFLSKFPELSGSVVLDLVTAEPDTYSYFYFNSKAGGSISLQFLESTGNPDFYVSRAVFSLTPNETEYEDSRNWEGGSDHLDLFFSTSECYAIGVYANGNSSSFVLEINSTETQDSDWDRTVRSPKLTSAAPAEILGSGAPEVAIGNQPNSNVVPVAAFAGVAVTVAVAAALFAVRRWKRTPNEIYNALNTREVKESYGAVMTREV